jgi:hypothetical protein
MIKSFGGMNISSKNPGVILDPPIIAVWGGKELSVKDLNGNNILLLEE